MTSDSEFKMVNVANKNATERRAVAQGWIKMSPATAKIIADRKLPKGDALIMAEIAGILGVKKTTEILPLCHPLPIESVRLKCEPVTDGVCVSCEVITTYKTGVEMEALMGVTAALLCIYDLTKPVDPVLRICDVHLVLKEGGKSGIWKNPQFKEGIAFDFNLSNTALEASSTKVSLKGIKTAVLTISDTCSDNAEKDLSGPKLKQLLEDREAPVLWTEIVPDEILAIQNMILEFKALGADLIISTGGTGVSARDVTPEAVSEMFTRKIDGFGELFRIEGAKRSPKSYLSRCVSGFIGETLVVTLPGSINACRDGIEILGDLIPHAIHIAKGGKHSQGHESIK